MEENKGTCGCENHGMCGAGMKGSMCYKKHISKKIFMIIALIFMFWVGLQLGELRTLVRMQESREHFGGVRMMNVDDGQGWGVQPDATQPTTTTPSTPATK